MQTAGTVTTAKFKSAMTRWASGVTIVTVLDQLGKPHGFTASSFASLSIDPPLVLVCLARDADCFNAVAHCQRFAVNILAESQRELAMQFATRGADKFDGMRTSDGHERPAHVDGSAAVFECENYAIHDGGDHVILVGRVVGLSSHGELPLLYFDRNFHAMGPEIG